MCLWRRLSNIYKLHLGCTFRTYSSCSPDLWYPLRSMTTRLEDETSPVSAPVSSLSNVSLLSRLSSQRETLISYPSSNCPRGRIYLICKTPAGYMSDQAPQGWLLSPRLPLSHQGRREGRGWYWQDVHCILVILVRISRSVCSGWGRRSTCQSEHPLENNCVIFVLLFHL